MKMRSLVLLICVVSAGCQNVKNPLNQAELADDNLRFCLTDVTETEIEHNCDPEYWLGFWLEASQMSWIKRQVLIEQYGSSKPDLLHKVLLSQADDTPDDARQQAQLWLQQLRPDLTPQSQSLLDLGIYQPSQQILALKDTMRVLEEDLDYQASSLAQLLRQLQLKEIQLNQQQQQLELQQQQLQQLMELQTEAKESTGEP